MIAQNIKRIKDSIAETAIKCGRNPEEILLVAVSKTFGIESIREAYEAGIRDFGENRAQELRDKAADIDFKVNWHFIGGLQSNKIKYVVGNASLIHSVDSRKLAEEIEERAKKLGIVQRILLELKTSPEASKGGFEHIEQLIDTASFCRASSFLKPEGLMTMAPFVDDETIIRNSFKALRETRDILDARGISLHHLSMGMTGDYKIAIEEGATILRIGTAIFGGR